MQLRLDGHTYDLRPADGGVMLDGEAYAAEVVRRRRHGETLELYVRLGPRSLRLWATPTADGALAIQFPGGFRTVATPAGAAAAARPTHGPVATPMAGVVTALHVVAGARVEAGAPLAVIEAMKMRYTLTAEADGTVTQVLVAEQALVAANQPIVHLAP